MTTTDESNSQPVLDVADLQVAYGDLVAVWGASLQLVPGRITALVGRNGAGKTTLLAGICGLLPARSGSVALDGRAVTGLPPWKRVRLGMSIVQEGKQVFRDLSVHDNLRVGLRGRRSGRGEDDTILAELYERFPVLGERRRERAGALSGGQQQMLAIATALAARPRVLLVDEPSSGLAPVITDQVFELLDRLRGEGLAILLVEQLVDELLGGIADDVVVLERGRVTLRDRAANLSAETIADSIYSSI
ncbi:ABC transporter ATP-binding protein [Actinomadura craniellae]|uniref:ABC transporter ATP-binding protein n=1 Tax=Actinomadura craniellae TaxID=2231787 RepID=A0A365GYL2_9ACTN|nr:ABC transporter ATP-binding protein [Actinomadura craniellae]RAY11919.1 ABC transporter ATP-binding protein [Actinomadura craniellae]